MTDSTSDTEYRLYLKPEGKDSFRRLLSGECFEGIWVSSMLNNPSVFMFERDVNGCVQAGEAPILFIVNGERIANAATIGDGATLQIGTTRYTAIVKSMEGQHTLTRRPEGLDGAIAARTIPLFVDCAAEIYQGLRANQEDYIAYDIRQEGDVLWMVADGVGGETKGDVASQFASDWTLWHYFNPVMGVNNPHVASMDIAPKARLTTAIQQAHEELIAYSNLLQKSKKKDDPEKLVTTTLTAAALHRNRWSIAQVGNSSAFLFRSSTRDMTELTSTKHVLQDDILRYCVGNPDGFLVDVFEEPALVGDFLLLCTDGLTGCVGHQEIQNYLFKASINDMPWLDVPRRLIELAKERNVADNVAIILIKVSDQPPAKRTRPSVDRICTQLQRAPHALSESTQRSVFRDLFKRK